MTATDHSTTEPELTGDIGAEFESWLDQDIPGLIENMIWIALPAERRRRRVEGPQNEILVRSTCPHPIRRPVSEITPEQLRAIADEHERLAEELSRDAGELREYADLLEQPAELGSAMLEHFRAMREEEAHKEAVSDEKRRLANAPGGVLKWEALDKQTREILRWEGLVRVDDVREAFRTGTLRKTPGIGAVRYTRIALALVQEGDA